jgi:hypothetical protein
MMIKFQDRATIGATKDTQDGYLIATSKVARTGIQIYRADEVGLMGSGSVRVYRPESEVFSKDALASLQHAPVTLNHPKELVTSDNWAQLAKGEVSTDILRDGDYLAASLIIKDTDATTSAKTTHREISLGYTAHITMQDGVTDRGEQYDAIMTEFNYNHLALVPKGRAGDKARIGDSAINWGASPVTTKGPEMDFKSLVFGDKAINVAVTDADKLTAYIADKDTEVGSLKAELAIKDAELKSFKDAAAAAIAEELAVATAALKANPLFGDEAISNASSVEIITMHKTVQRLADTASAAKDDTARKTIADMKAKTIVTDNGQAAYRARLENAWKGE